jgi:predicted nucleic acid-binding Zn ribbon protein
VLNRKATRQPGKPARVSEVLAGYLKSAGLAERIEQAAVVTDWPQLVGRDIAKVAVAESITRDGTLFVRVNSSAWRQELSLMTPEIMARINAGRTQGRIEKIRWLVGG